jgi:hypothetical protein
MFVRPLDGPAVILIGEGEYHETINITRKGPVTLLVCATKLFIGCASDEHWF